MVKIALAQINPCVGDLEGNTQLIVRFIQRAQRQGCELVVFPELALCGYPPEDLLLKDYFITRNKQYLQKVRKACKGITALVGFVDKKKGALYNACAVIQDGKIQDVYHKIALPNYGVFDEKRYFTAGGTLPVYLYKDYRFCITICEDLWDASWVDLLSEQHPDFVINISASPFHLRKVALRKKILSTAARKLQSHVFYCNLVGGQDEIVFDGTSKVFSAHGTMIGVARRFQEDLFVFTLNPGKKHSRRPVSMQEKEETFCALRLGLADYVHKNGFRKVIVGVSGGIDSAVVLALAQMALGNTNVEALLMPSCYTSKATFADAKKVCKNLGVKQSVVGIDDIFKTYQKALGLSSLKGRSDKTEENLQARIRGNFLMAFSNRLGYLVLNTGNKSEVSCGYCTLYGDMVGGFGVLKDVPKMLVYKLASYINALHGRAVIPSSIIRRAPSAELAPNQKDTDSLPPYPVLDPILKLYVEDNLSLKEIVSRGYDRAVVKKIIALVDANEYKRRQGPVGIKITPRAFGKDRRMPITNKF